MKVLVAAAAVVLVIMVLMPKKAESKGDGPKVTDVVSFLRNKKSYYY